MVVTAHAMDTFLQLFQHVPEARIIACRSCRIAIPPAYVARHLKERHSKVPAAARQGVAACAHSLSNLAWSPAELHLSKPIKAISDLKSYEDGLVCIVKGCWYMCLSVRGIQSHCSNAHSWVNDQKRGGDMRRKSKQSSNRLWKDKQPCQRLFKAAGWPAYLAVEASSELTEEPVLRYVQADRQHQHQVQASGAGRDMIRGGIRSQADPWLELTLWVPHLTDISRSFLLRARALVEEDKKDELTQDERALGAACKAMQRLIRKAFESSQAKVVGRLTLEIIERREVGASSNERPFYAGHQVDTIKKYSRKVLHILCYLWRTYNKPERPPYTLTSTQGATLRLLQELALSNGRGQREELERQCLQFWLALLDQTLYGDEHESGLLSGIAVLGLRHDQHGGGWLQAHEFSSTLSALITTSKALVVHEARCRREAALGERADMAPTVYELVRDMSEKFLTLSDYHSSPSPMNRMLRLRTLARTQAKKRNTPGILSWDGNRLLIEKASFTLADVRSMVKGLYETVRDQLYQDVLLLDVDERGGVRPGTTQLPELCMDDLIDQPANMTPGWSFFQHPDNKMEKWKDWMFNRLLDESPLATRFVRGVDHTQQPPRTLWLENAVAQYMKGVRRCKEGLFVLAHFSAGGPGRGPEVTSIQCENSADGIGYRGVLVDRGLVSLVANYHKGYSFSRTIKNIHRYLPREVSELVVYFIGLAKPFIDDLQMMCNGVERPTSFLWEPAPEEAWGRDSDSDSSTGSDCGVGEADKPRSANPDGYWGTDRVRRVLREYTSKYMNAAIGTRAWRHAYPAIHRELTQDGQARDWLEVLYWGKESARSNAQALQSGHTLQTEETNYGRSAAESPFQTSAERNEFRRVSMDWHRILEFASAWDDRDLHPQCKAAMIASQEAKSLERWSTLATTDLKDKLGRLVGRPGAEFRGCQEEALRAIVQRKPRVLAVMGTGAGKSVLFMLPASLSPCGVTIVIVPLTTLQDDIQDRCDELGIACAKWTGEKPPYWARIVLITPESAVTKSFGRFIDEQRMLRKLDRIVVDECHVLLESSASWRPDVLKLTEMTEKGTQVVYLTATLPPVLQPAFLQTAGLDIKTVTVCRDVSTSRRNIAYQVLEYARDDLDDVLVQLIKRKRDRYGPAAQVLVYCPTIDETKRLATVLQCTAYYREMGTDEEKARQVRAFTSGATKICTATTMLSLGLNAPYVRVVIHVTMARSLSQYVQDSGRAGRTGLDSEAVVLRSCWPSKNGGIIKALGSKLEKVAKNFVLTTKCRRIILDGYMDGRADRQRCEVGETKCDICAAQPQGTKRQRVAGRPEASRSLVESHRQDLQHAMLIEQQKVEIQQRRSHEQVLYELERLEQYLRRWSRVCSLCMASTGKTEQHKWKDCLLAGAAQKQAMEESYMSLGRVKWEPYAGCLYCRAPQAVCNRWEETSTQGTFKSRGCRVGCQFEGVLQSSVAALLAVQAEVCITWVEQQLQRAGLVSGKAAEQMYIWLGQKVKIGQRDASRMCCLLYAWEEGVVQRLDATLDSGYIPKRLCY